MSIEFIQAVSNYNHEFDCDFGSLVLKIFLADQKSI